jgi:hypothetical protein
VIIADRRWDFVRPPFVVELERTIGAKSLPVSYCFESLYWHGGDQAGRKEED